MKLRLGDSSDINIPDLIAKLKNQVEKMVVFLFENGIYKYPPKAIWNMDKDDELHFLVQYFQINPTGLPFSVTVKLHFQLDASLQ